MFYIASGYTATFIICSHSYIQTMQMSQDMDNLDFFFSSLEKATKWLECMNVWLK
jgi:hypothetical protein